MGKKAKKISSSALIPIERIENRILLIRGEKVMLDKDLAEMYGVPTKRLNEQIKRNRERFPGDFMFQLTRMEAEFLIREGLIDNDLKSQFATSNDKNGQYKLNLKSQNVTSSWGGRRKLPYVFTEQGVAMLSSVLKSKKAIEVNIAIMRAFVKIRKLVYSYKDLAEKIAKIEQSHNKEIGRIWNVLNRLMSDEKPATGEIGFKVS